MAKLPPFVPIARKAFLPMDKGGDVFWNETRVFSRWEAWLDLIQSAARKPVRRIVNRPRQPPVIVDLDVGELLASVRFLAQRWKWSRKKVETFVSRLARDLNRIEAKTETPVGTVYRLVNFELFNVGETPDETPGRHPGDTRETPGRQSIRSKEEVREDVNQDEKEKQQSREADRLSDVEKSISEIIMTCNKGMSKNPNLQHFEPILPNGSSRQVVGEWLDDGIPAELCRRVVFERARAYRPNERNRQISSLRYLNNAVRDEWTRQQSGGVPTPQTEKPSPGSEADRVRQEIPQAGGKRAGGFRTVAGEKSESQSDIDDRRVQEWARTHAEEAAVIHQECVEEIAALPHADMIGPSTAQLMVRSKFRERVLTEKLTPKLSVA